MMTVPAPKTVSPEASGEWCRQQTGERTQTPPFEQLYEQHFEFIWRSVRGLGVQSAFVDDVTQDVFIVAHRRLSTYEASGSLRSWLFGIARRVCRDHRRSAQRKGPHIEVDDQQPAKHDDQEQRVASRQVLALVERFAESLDDERREIFFLALIEGLPVAEVAETLGLNANTTYSRVRVLRHELARLLNESQQDPGGSNGPR